MKHILTIIILLLSATCFSQKIDFDYLMKLNSVTLNQFETIVKSKGWTKMEVSQEGRQALDYGYSNGKNYFLIIKSLYNAGYRTMYYATTIQSEHAAFKKALLDRGYTLLGTEKAPDESVMDSYHKDGVTIKLSKKLQKVQGVTSYSIQIRTDD